MSRFSKIIAVGAGALLALMPLHPVTAAETTKKSSTKKSSTSTKKKSTTGTTGTKPATGETDAAGEKKSNSLDLPLPEKVPGTDKEKKSSEAEPPTSKTSKKSASTTAEPKDKPAEMPEAATAESKDKAAEKSAATTTAESKDKPERAPAAVVEPEAISEFAAQSPRVQQMFRDAIDLTRQNLTYTFGSADPSKGGMDCSGTIFYLLNAHGFKDVPRDSRGQYMWARKSGAFFPVVSSNAESEEFKELLPGDLMFWTGTYQTGRDIPISHVMMYLGREKAGSKRIMFGASDGRSYNGIQRWGVSVFDFKMPKADGNGGDKPGPRFVGYARIPGLRTGLVAAAETVASEAEKAEKFEKPDTEDAPKTTPKASTTTAKSSTPLRKSSTPTPSKKKKSAKSE